MYELRRFLKFLSCFRFWECYCIYRGDNPFCPQHGRIAWTRRFVILTGITFLVYVILSLAAQNGISNPLR